MRHWARGGIHACKACKVVGRGAGDVTELEDALLRLGQVHLHRWGASVVQTKWEATAFKSVNETRGVG